MEIRDAISTEELINKFEDMAHRGTLLTGNKVSQEDLLVQIVGTILKVAMDESKY